MSQHSNAIFNEKYAAVQLGINTLETLIASLNMNPENTGVPDDSTQPGSQTEGPERPWIVWENTYEVETWIGHLDRELQQAATRPNAVGYGICFRLEQGGDIYLHTHPEGVVLLDVTPEAEWVAPLISAATGVAAPRGQIWTLPDQALTQLVLGLSPLVASSRMVFSHDYKIKKQY